MTEPTQGTYREAWEAAKDCQRRTGVHASLSVSLTRHNEGREWTSIDCHSGGDYQHVETFAQAVAFFNSKGRTDVDCGELLSDLPEILEAVKS